MIKFYVNTGHVIFRCILNYFHVIANGERCGDTIFKENLFYDNRIILLVTDITTVTHTSGTTFVDLMPDVVKTKNNRT